MVKGVVVALEDPVREVVVAQELPEVFDRVALRCAGRQGHEGDAVRDLQFAGEVPAGLIQQKDGMGAWVDLGCDLFQVLVHGMAVAVGHDQAGALALAGQIAPKM